jgi:hypothetical protein
LPSFPGPEAGARDKNAKSNLNYNPKSTLTTVRALTYNTCYIYIIKKESRVLDS